MAAMPGSGLVSGKGSGYQTPPLHAARGPHRQCTASRPRAESLPSQQHQVLSQHVGQLGEKAASGGLQPTKPFARPQIGQVLGRAPGWPARPPSGRPGRRWNHVPAAAEPSISAAGADRPAPRRRLACCAGRTTSASSASTSQLPSSTLKAARRAKASVVVLALSLASQGCALVPAPPVARVA